jgi:hypothetical protein
MPYDYSQYSYMICTKKGAPKNSLYHHFQAD